VTAPYHYLHPAKATDENVRIAEDRARVFETMVPWPALAASWRRTAEDLKRQMAQENER
jgi:hypothetical protein